jgi:homocysteine S-methyltransferase
MLKPAGQVTIFDGAVGTELYERGFYINRPFEELNVSAPADVRAVHLAYIEAGADLLTTNTFSITRPQLKKFDIDGQQEKLLIAALKLANDARGGAANPRGIQLGLSIGPLGVLVEPLGPYGLDEAREDFATVARIACGAAEAGTPFEAYLLETFTNVDELLAAVDGIRSVDRKRPLLASLSVQSGDPKLVHTFAERLGARDDVEALGLNCCDGPSDLFTSLKLLHTLTSKPIVVRPNAGVPRQVNGRYFYMTSPDYLAKYAKRFAEAGAAGIGGCCGTGPEHIRAIRNSVRMANARALGSDRSAHDEDPARIESRERSRPSLELRASYSSIASQLSQGRKVLSIEVLPPKGTEIEPFLEGVSRIADAGISFVNIPDGARASTRVSSLHLSAVVQSRLGGKVTAIPHFTTRDRNLIALQADLLGASVSGVHQVLLVTGDPPKLGNNRDATGVYDIDSIGLTYLADCLNRGVTPSGDALGSHTHFAIGVASNPTAINPEVELQRWKYKVESGADYAVTQPIFDPESYLRWRDQLGASDRPHVVGIWPLVSLRNAEFMANEVPGVHVPKWALEEMEKAGDNRSEAEKRGIEIARRVIRELESRCEGFCVSAPLGRIDTALRTLGKGDATS